MSPRLEVCQVLDSRVSPRLQVYTPGIGLKGESQAAGMPGIGLKGESQVRGMPGIGLKGESQVAGIYARYWTQG